MSDTEESPVRRNLYGLRGSRLRGGRRAAFEERRARHAAIGEEGAPRLAGASEIWLEVGFGAGEHLLAQARANPDVLLIGCEHYVDGAASCLSKLEAEGIGNARVHHGDARDLMDALPGASVGRAFLL